MSNFGVMVETIRDDINRGSAYDSRIKKAIESAIKVYRSQRFWFNTQRATAGTLAGYEFIPLPDDCIEIDHMRVTDSSNDSDSMTEVTYEWIEDHRDADDTGEPWKFAVHQNQIHLYPVPDGAYTLTMTYHRDLTEVSASASDAATNAWMTDAEEMIRMRAMADLYQVHLRGPESRQTAQDLRSRAGEVFTELKRRTNRLLSSGRVRQSL